jgi:LEA14-like dessication related protein
MSVVEVDFIGISSLCRFEIKNNDTTDIAFPSIQWELYLQDTFFTAGTLATEGRIKRGKSALGALPIRVYYQDIYNLFKYGFEVDSIDYTLILNTDFVPSGAAPLTGTQRISATLYGTLPIVRMPLIIFKGITIQSVSTQTVAFMMEWEIENRNAMPVQIERFDYDLTVNNRSWGRGRVAQSLALLPNVVTTIPIMLSINSASIAQDITGYITQEMDAAYLCTGNIRMLSAVPGMGAIDMPYQVSGHTVLQGLPGNQYNTRPAEGEQSTTNPSQLRLR